MAETAATSTTFWTNDDAWQITWPAAIAFAMLFHGFAFVMTDKTPAKMKPPTIAMDIKMPPPPPEPPPPPPPEPKHEKPPPPQKKSELPPPPNETPPPDKPPEEVKPVTGVTADSVVPANSGGPQVRVGNTTFGNPDEEKFTPPQDVQKPAAQPFDLAGYRRRVFDTMDHAKRYPRKAKVLGLEGKCLVKLVINRDGTLAEEPKVLKGSGHDVLDAECLRMARAETFPPIVGDTEVPLHMTQAISFSLLEADKY